MSFFSIFKKKTKLEQYLQRHGNDKGMDMLFEQREIYGVIAYLFILYAHNAVSNDKDFRKIFKGTSPEVLMYETAMFDFFTIVYLMDSRNQRELRSITNSVIKHQLFMETLTEIAIIFESLCGFDRNIATSRFNGYVNINTFPLEFSNLKATYNIYLESSLNAQTPTEKVSNENLFKFDLMDRMSVLLFHSEIRHTTMHEPLYKSILDILKHFKKTETIYEKIK